MTDKVNMVNNFYSKSNKNQLPPALKKLTEYNKKMENSDFFNSYSRYSVELKLLKDAIIEAESLNDKESAVALKKRKAQVEEHLKNMGFIIKE